MDIVSREEFDNLKRNLITKAELKDLENAIIAAFGNRKAKEQKILDKVAYAKDKKAAKLKRAKDEGFEIYRNKDYKEA